MLRKKLIIPGYAFVAYVYITFFLAVAGPFDYLVLNSAKVFLFLTYVLVCFIMGYRFSLTKKFSGESIIKPGRINWVLIGIVLGVATTGYVLFHGGSSNSLAAAMTDPGTAYREALMAARKNLDVSLVSQIQTTTYGLTICAVVAVCVAWKSYPRWILYLAMCYPLLQLALAVRMGTFKFVGDWLIFALTIYSLSRAKVISSRQKALMAMAILIFFVAHIYSQESRKMAYGMATSYSYLSMTEFRSDNVVAKVLGAKTYEALANPVFYATNGYAGLSAALDQDFVWTYGLGNSGALMGYARQYLDIDLLPQTYMVRAEEKTGWPALVYWSTIFPWIASDISFTGCGVLFAFIGFIYPRILYRAYYSRCPLSATLLFYLNVLLIYVPCNNQMMQMRQAMVAFVGTSLAYWIGVNVLPDRFYPGVRGRFRPTRWRTGKTKVRFKLV
jgi:hypothetical protein